MPFDPFGDFETRGTLRNLAVEKDPERVRRLEHHAFAANVMTALAAALNTASPDALVVLSLTTELPA